MKVVLKLTGKVFEEGYEDLIKGIASLVSEKVGIGDRVAVITGGGSTARKYVELGGRCGLSNSWMDLLGIKASRLNALLFAAVLKGRAYLPIPTSIGEFLNAWSTGKVVVLGGLQPGQSTNAVAAVIAELINADLLINATNVDGVYLEDPKRKPGLKPLKEVRIDVLKRIVSEQRFLPGHYELLDAVALRIIERSRIKLVFVNAFKIDKLRKAWNLSPDAGTWVKY